MSFRISFILCVSATLSACNCGTTAVETTTTAVGAGTSGATSAAATTASGATTSAAVASTTASAATTGGATSAGPTSHGAISSGAATSGATTSGTTGTTTGGATGAATSSGATTSGTTGAASSAATSASGTSSGGSTSSGSGTTSGSTTGGISCSPKVTNPLYIDGFAGVDSPCCGATQGAACHTLTQAMANIVNSDSSAITLDAFMSNAAPDWTGPETWPVVLHLGVTLSAPGLYFSNSSGSPTDLFHVSINRQSPLGDDYAAIYIQGTSASPVNIGFNSSNDDTGTASAIAVVTTSTLHLQDANLAGAVGVQVGANGSETATSGIVIFGPDPVNIGGLATGLLGTTGIQCTGTATSQSSIEGYVGSPLPTAPVLYVAGETTDIDVALACNIDLEFGGMVLGPSFDGGACPPKVDQTGIYVHSGGAVQASLATVQCQAGDGVYIEASDDAGSPLVQFADSLLAHNGCAGLHMLNGQDVTLSSSGGDCVVSNNHYGVHIEGGGFFEQAQNATIACNTASEPGNCAGQGPGIDVWQQGSVAATFDDVTWDTATPQTYTCAGSGFAGCSWGATAPAEAEIVIEPPDAGTVSDYSPSSTPAVCL